MTTLSESQQRIANEGAEIAEQVLSNFKPLSERVTVMSRTTNLGDLYRYEFDRCVDLLAGDRINPTRINAFIECLLGLLTVQRYNNDTKERMLQVFEETVKMLLEKNAAYGDSALHPVRIFSKADAAEQIKVRLDDKVSRIVRGNATAFGEDVILDLIGYFVLLRVAISQRSA